MNPDLERLFSLSKIFSLHNAITAKEVTKMNILKENKFARDMLTIATIGCILAGLYGAAREDEQNRQKATAETVAAYEVPE